MHTHTQYINKQMLRTKDHRAEAARLHHIPVPPAACFAYRGGQKVSVGQPHTAHIVHQTVIAKSKYKNSHSMHPCRLCEQMKRNQGIRIMYWCLGETCPEDHLEAGQVSRC